jgi:hypothetical protein
MKLAQRILGFVGVAFGLATIVAGGRVLAGADPGYVVFRPLLFFNTAMGVVYVATGVITLRSVARGKLAAAAIFALNLLVLGIIGYVYATTSDVAIDSIRAMSFRTFVWLVVFLGLAWLDRGRHAPGSG